MLRSLVGSEMCIRDSLTPQLPCRSTGPKWRLHVHNPSAETNATDDNQSSKHNQYATRRNNRSWLDLPLEIPSLLLGRAAMASHIRSVVPAPVAGTIDICGTARRVAKHYRGWAARRHFIEIQRHVQGEGGGYSFESRRSHARVGLGCNRLGSTATEHSILPVSYTHLTLPTTPYV